MATTTSPAATGGARVRIQRFGTFLSNMVMPNIGAFIAWGLITALFIEKGWITGLTDRWDGPGSFVAEIGGWGDFAGGGIVGTMITYLLPILIGYTGGKIIYETRGGVVGAIATFGVIAGTEIPMFMGAMIMGPFGRLVDETDRRDLGRQGQARVRDAGQQLCGGHLGHGSRDVRLLRDEPAPDPDQRHSR